MDSRSTSGGGLADRYINLSSVVLLFVSPHHVGLPLVLSLLGLAPVFDFKMSPIPDVNMEVTSVPRVLHVWTVLSAKEWIRSAIIEFCGSEEFLRLDLTSCQVSRGALPFFHAVRANWNMCYLLVIGLL
ncbi:hypothetical protein CPB85DRAFT_1430661 [Mucidula mucida]|nr:hypothetical protein CPB85DRAFT_1446131 [Mucidula mucida]KAF8918036.1 hypothetical protein CPB85DRAFT_1430661 [Mucidula mucida]